MSLNRNEKEAVVEEVAAQVAAKLRRSALAEYRGITVDHMTQAAQRRRASKGVYLTCSEEHAGPPRCRRHAVRGGVGDQMTGPLIYGFSEDAVAAAKVIADFAKTNDKLVIKAGAYAGKALDVNGVKPLASIPVQGSAAGPAAAA